MIGEGPRESSTASLQRRIAVLERENEEQAAQLATLHEELARAKSAITPRVLDAADETSITLLQAGHIAEEESPERTVISLGDGLSRPKKRRRLSDFGTVNVATGE